MNSVEVLKDEHLQIERELVEFEEVMDSEVINYSNLVHVFNKFRRIWDEHEGKEVGIFAVMAREGIKIPVEKISCDHEELRGHIKEIVGAINSGDDSKVRECFDKDLKVIIEKIRAHILMEDEILYTFSDDELSGESLEEMENFLSN